MGEWVATRSLRTRPSEAFSVIAIWRFQMRPRSPVHPGEMLDEEFLKPLGLTKYRLAKDIGVPPQRIGDIVAGKRSITADTDLRLCRYFGLSDGWWLRGQANYDTAVAREAMGEALSRISRCQLLGA